MSLRDDDRLDEMIDRVARDLIAGDPPAGLAARVRARIAGGERGPGLAAWRPATAAAVLVLTVVVATARWPQQPPEQPGVQRAMRPADAGPAKAGHDVPEETLPPDSYAGAGFSRPEVTATADAAPLPAIDPLAIPLIEDPVLVAEMSDLAMPIEIEPLQIAPLELQ
jgi:hypothetical protein